MKILRKIVDAINPTPKSPEDLAAQAEAERVRDEMETIRLSQRSAAGENYQSGRGSDTL